MAHEEYNKYSYISLNGKFSVHKYLRILICSDIICLRLHYNWFYVNI